MKSIRDVEVVPFVDDKEFVIGISHMVITDSHDRMLELSKGNVPPFSSDDPVHAAFRAALIDAPDARLYATDIVEPRIKASLEPVNLDPWGIWLLPLAEHYYKPAERIGGVVLRDRTGPGCIWIPPGSEFHATTHGKLVAIQDLIG